MTSAIEEKRPNVHMWKTKLVTERPNQALMTKAIIKGRINGTEKNDNPISMTIKMNATHKRNNNSAYTPREDKICKIIVKEANQTTPKDCFGTSSVVISQPHIRERARLAIEEPTKTKILETRVSVLWPAECGPAETSSPSES